MIKVHTLYTTYMRNEHSCLYEFESVEYNHLKTFSAKQYKGYLNLNIQKSSRRYRYTKRPVFDQIELISLLLARLLPLLLGLQISSHIHLLHCVLYLSQLNIYNLS